MSTISNKIKGKKKWWILSLIIVALVIIGIYKRPLIMAYYDELKLNHYKNGDAMYLSTYYINDFPKEEIPIFRLIKPHHSNILIMFPTNKKISRNILATYKKTSIGTYIQSRFLDLSNKDTSRILRLYALKPNPKIIIINDRSKSLSLIQGYEYVDTNFYIPAFYTDLASFLASYK